MDGDNNNNADGGGGDEEVVQPSPTAKQFLALKKSIHRLYDFVGTDPAFDNLSVEALRLRHDRLEGLWNNVNDVYMKLTGELGPDQVEQYEDKFAETEKEYFDAAEVIVKRGKDLEPNEPTVNREASVAGSEQEKPPIKVIIPPQQTSIRNTWGMFDGQWLKWLGFRDRFLTAIHHNEDVNESYKMQYLVQSLKGHPLELIGDPSEAKNSYQDTWNRLRQFYDRPYRIALEVLRQFDALPALQTKATATDLQQMSNVTHETLTQLRALDLPVDQYDFILVARLHDRLDKDTRTEWNKFRPDKEIPTIDKMLEFLDREAAALAGDSENRPPSRAPKESNQRNKSKERSKERKQEQSMDRLGAVGGSAHGYRAPLTDRYTGTIPKKQPCEACPEGSQQFHPLFHCPVFEQLGLNARKEFVQRRNICPNCFRKGHNIGSCNQVRCSARACRDNPFHNSMLCPFKWNQEKKPSSINNALNKGKKA